MQIAEAEIRAKADELAALSLQADITKLKIDNLKGYFQRLAVQQLRDQKVKTIEYWGNENVKVTVSTAESVKPVSVTSLKSVFGDVFCDFVKEEMSYTMTAPCKQLLAIAFQGEYASGSLDETIKQISTDATIQQALRKKLKGKGKFEQDKKTLMTIAELPEQEASDWAYLAAEVINWEWLTQILKSANWSGKAEEAIAIIKAAVIVDESIKVTVNSDK